MATLRLTSVLLIASTLLAACANEPYLQSQPVVANGTGVVNRIEVVNKSASPGIAGTVIGGIVGGLIGHEIGGGSGQTATTILGAAGGAAAGNMVGKRALGPDETYRVTVHMNRGGYEVVTQDNITNLRRGDKVRIENGHIYRG